MNADRFFAITGRYPSLQIGVVGDFFLDRYLHIDPAKDETSIETGLTVYNVVEVRAQPGAAGTIVSNLVALGVGEIYAAGFCGDDGEGYELRRALSALPGVNLDHFLTTTSRRTPVYCKPMVLSPGRPPRELNRLDSKNWTRTPQDLERDLSSRLTTLAERMNALLLLDQVELSETGVITEMVKQAAHAAQQNNERLVVLADSRQGLQHFPPLGYKMNVAELTRMTARSVPRWSRSPDGTGEPDGIGGGDSDRAMTASVDVDAVKRQAAELARRTGHVVFVTMADRGIVGASPGSGPEHASAFPVRGPIDIVGAGDAVTANLAAALASGASLDEAMELAMAAASLVIHQLGTTGTASVAQIASLVIKSLSP